jgi:hypothetical protein
MGRSTRTGDRIMAAISASSEALGIGEAKLVSVRAAHPEDLVGRLAQALQQVFELGLGPAGLEVLDHRGLDPVFAQQGQGVAGGPAGGVVVDDDVAHGLRITPPGG